MPELPEAETIACTLGPLIAGQRIREAVYPGRRVWRGRRPPDLRGRRIEQVSRYGKRVLMHLESGCLQVQLGMTGALLLGSAPGPYTRARWLLDRGELLFDDIRQFGSLALLAEPPDDLGPDPLEIGAREFAERIKRRRTQVKRLLLDQRFVRGLGNIYSDEALFRAGIHPRATASALPARRAELLHREIGKLLRRAIERGGSSISDYVNALGQPGRFQLEHRVYGKEGAPCPRCAQPIRRIVLAQRGTHYCPRCQRL